MPRGSGHTKRPHQKQLMGQVLTKGMPLPPKPREPSEPRTLPKTISITSKNTQQSEIKPIIIIIVIISAH